MAHMHVFTMHSSDFTYVALYVSHNFVQELERQATGEETIHLPTSVEESDVTCGAQVKYCCWMLPLNLPSNIPLLWRRRKQEKSQMLMI